MRAFTGGRTRRRPLVDILHPYLSGQDGDLVPTFASFINDREIGADRYVYTVTARSILQDVFASLTLKRRLEQGAVDPAAAAGSIVGRCAFADLDTAAQALDAAAAAAPVWAAMPLETRMRLGVGIRERLRHGHRDLVEVLVAEGTPRSLVEWQVSGMFEFFSDETLDWCASQMWQEFRHALMMHQAMGCQQILESAGHRLIVIQRPGIERLPNPRRSNPLGRHLSKSPAPSR